MNLKLMKTIENADGKDLDFQMHDSQVAKVFEKDGIIVGALIIAPHAGEMIGEAALAVRLQIKSQAMSDTIHAHPTLPESLVDAARDINNEALHLPHRKKKYNV